MEASILRTKLFIPPRRPDALSRPRLLAKLNQGLGAANKLILVSAPAGYGKTSLVAEWIGSKMSASSSDQFTWLALDHSHNNPARFFAYLIASLEILFPSLADIGERAAGRMTVPHDETLLALLLNRIIGVMDVERGICPKRLLVLDDYHLIHEAAVHDSLYYFLDNLPPSLFLVITSRTDPPWPLARLRAGRQLLELRTTDLAFTLDETSALLNDVIKLNLSAADILKLHKQTEGWVAGLQLAALAIRDLQEEERANFLQAVAGTIRYIDQYLFSEVLASRSESTQLFLLRTSILERLSGPLCDAVTGSSDGDLRLQDMVRKNMFIIPLDLEGRWYRYHHLFSELLKRNLEDKWPGLKPELHLRASEWYEVNGLHSSSIEHLLLAGKFDNCADLIERELDPLFKGGDFITLLEWLDSLPADVYQSRPRLNTYYGITLVLAGRPLAEVEERIKQVSETEIAGAQTGELRLLNALVATLQGDESLAYALALEALELIPEEARFLRGLLHRTLGAVFKLTGDIKAYDWAVAESARIAVSDGDRLGLIAATHQKAEIAILRGELQEGMDLCQDGLVMAKLSAELVAPPAIKILVNMADLLREWNDLDSAEEHAIKAIELAGQSLRIWTIGAYAVLARINQAQGKIAGMLNSLKIAERLAKAYDASEMDDFFVAAQKARLMLVSGEGDQAWIWVRNRNLDAPSRAKKSQESTSYSQWPYQIKEYELITAARIFLARGQPEDTLAAVNQLGLEAERLGRLGAVIEIRVLQALARSDLQETDLSLKLLKQSLYRAETGGYIRLFIDFGKPMSDLIHKLVESGGSTPYIERLLRAFKFGSNIPLSQKDQTGVFEPLSRRELQVLRLLTTHMSSTEIAGELGISANTVRFHIKNIYSKLGVHNRTDAVTAARIQGLFGTSFLNITS